jgi:hypothetical protein
MKIVIATVSGREITLDESTSQEFLTLLDKDGRINKEAIVVNDSETGKTKSIIYSHCIEQIDFKY